MARLDVMELDWHLELHTQVQRQTRYLKSRARGLGNAVRRVDNLSAVKRAVGGNSEEITEAQL
eukprot:IDg15739t1